MINNCEQETTAKGGPYYVYFIDPSFVVVVIVVGTCKLMSRDV